MYPFYAENGGRVRKTLQTKKIYIPTLWPDVLEQCGEESLEYQYAENILPLPVDQRYDLQDMAYVVSEVMKCID